MTGLLYGHNSDERIVAVQQLNDSTMRLYFREDGTVRSADEPFYPFLFLADTNLLEGFAHRHWLKKLEGNAYYSHLCVFEGWTSLWDAIRYILDRFNKTAVTKVESYAQLDEIHLYSDPVTQFLLQSGRTLFKGMQFGELHRLQLDIETYTSPQSRFSNAARPDDRIILIALSDSTGWEHLINGKKLTEKEMLQELVRIITERNPDVIEGHNIFNFDLPYIIQRCERHGVPFTIGRDGSIPRSFETRMSFAERTLEYSIAEIAGRHVIDTRILVQSYDMTKRDMESHGLKYAAQYFGLSAPQRTYVQGDRISWHWDHDVQPLMTYALDDVRETRALSNHLSGTSFYLTQMVPMNYGGVSRSGSAAKIESLLARTYLREKQSLPKPASGTQTSGGYTNVFVIGVVGPVVHADVESLYPSIMLSRKIAPSSDHLGVFQTLLQNLTTLRLDTKRRMRASTDPEEKSRLDASQSSLKILINSFYGYLGYGRGLFNDFAAADMVTRTGRELLHVMMEKIRADGGKVIEVDTDGVFFIPPDNARDEDAETAFVHRLSSSLPEGITVALDGRYKRMLSYKMKNYALLGYDDRMKIKGSSFTSRSMERFGRHYVTQCIECMLRDDVQGLHTLYSSIHHAIMDRKLDITDFVRVETLRDTLEKYRADVEAGKRNKSAAYEIALATGGQARIGDRVAFYITGHDPNIRTFESCKPSEEWDPNFQDQNTAYYVRKLDEFSEKFKPFFLPQDYRSIFSADDLFPFSPVGITPLTLELPANAPADTPQSPDFRIWLDEQN